MRVITQELFNAYVPVCGKADTVKGEVLRAFARIECRYYNDGDCIGTDYGNETCNAPARYLSEKVPDAKLFIGQMWGKSPSAEYKRLLNGFEAVIIDAIRERPNEFNASNSDDMWDWYDRVEDEAYLADDDEEW